VRADQPRRLDHTAGPVRPGAGLPLGHPSAARRRKHNRRRHDPGVPGAVGHRDLRHVPARPRAAPPPGRPVLLRCRRRRRAAPAAALLPAAGRVAARRVRAHRARGAAQEVVGRGARGHASAARRLGGVRGRGGPRAAGRGRGDPAARQRDVRRRVLLLRGETEADGVRAASGPGRDVGAGRRGGQEAGARLRAPARRLRLLQVPSCSYQGEILKLMESCMKLYNLTRLFDARAWNNASMPAGFH
jgi:hypothetical protein